MNALKVGTTTTRGTPRKIESHGMSYGPEYRTWKNMLARCCNPANKGFRDYGAKGIGVCDEWRTSFLSFYEHVGPRPSPKHSIDRIDNLRSYEPGNIRWATRLEQQQNTRKNVYITHGGETLCVREWSRRTGIGKSTILQRIRSGLPAENILCHSVKRPAELQGVSLNKRTGKWVAYGRGRPRVHLGTFGTQVEAMAAVKANAQGQ